MYPKINVKRPIPYSVVILFTSVDARVKESHIMIVPDITGVTNTVKNNQNAPIR